MEKKNETKEPTKPEEPKKPEGELTDEDMDKVSGGRIKHFNPQPDPPLG